MNEQGEQGCSASEAGDSLMEARLLARRGCYAEAAAQLADALARGECTEAEALDVKARICAQQGLLLQAEACWRKAQSLDADNPAYADALTALRQTQRPFAIRRRTAAWVGFAALPLLLLGTLAAGHRSVIRNQLTLGQRLTALELKIGELRDPLDRGIEAAALASAALAKVADADAAACQKSEVLHQAVADLRNEMDRRQQDWTTRQETSRHALCQAINDRLKAEARRQHETVEAKLGLAEARQKARDETVDAELRKTRESLAALETVRAEDERKRGPTNLWEHRLAPDRLDY